MVHHARGSRRDRIPHPVTSPGDVIAHNTTAAEGYGTTPVERAQFIVDTIRIPLGRQACTHHLDELSSIEAILGTEALWCPACGTRLGRR
ncbi:MAG: hypothetical protein QOD02_4438 [Mycobacterium sp.]|nr:hypothetical protein [Mycobacterium sp.]